LVVVANGSAPVLVGVVSYGSEECGEEEKVGIYARVQHFTAWIEQVMKS
jgi:secreted trypsin-like serine protease